MTTTNLPDAPRRRSFLAMLLQPKVGIPLAILIVLAAAPFVYRQSRVAGIPDIGEPFDLETFGTVVIAPADNAYEGYRTAVAAKWTLTSGGAYDEDADWEDLPQDYKEWVEANRAALDLWAAATARPDAVDVQPRDHQIGTLLDMTSELRVFARLAHAEGKRLEHAGRPAEEWKVYRASFRCSRHVGMHGCLIERLTGIALHDYVCADAARWSRRPDVTTAMLEQALADIESDYALTAPLSDTLKCEYWCFHNTLGEPDLWEVVPASSMGPLAWLPDNETAGRIRWFLSNEPHVSSLLARQAFANILEHIDKPRADRPPAHGSQLGLFKGPPAAHPPARRLTASEIDSRLTRAPLLTMMYPALLQVDIAVTSEQARQRALVVAFALQIYKCRQGSFPSDLAALVVEGALTDVPLDPFATSLQPLKYRTEEARTIVWSIGKNGIDDGGVIEPEKSPDGDLGVVVESEGSSQTP